MCEDDDLMAPTDGLEHSPGHLDPMVVEVHEGIVHNERQGHPLGQLPRHRDPQRQV